ncbi:hypothetical protein BP5796_00247 [Coleophoma crateriformis]|uniref:Sialidase n=1 Tax=Coleophoma crateriformis TaxID=565419 RepID=A0A3D8T7I9_9HELO|nr:hypothetical protein BP5796_00247 [Coleophoma crateriformis]
MSFDYSFSFGPATPPSFSFEEALPDGAFRATHSRSNSYASLYSQDSSPESVATHLTTPMKSPIRHHGPLLLPKIRPQDQEIHSPAKRFKQTPLSKPLNSAAAFRPSHTRSYTNPESISFIQQDHGFQAHAVPETMSLGSPISMDATLQQRRASSASLDGQTLGKYGFPTYRQMPAYISSTTNSHPESYVPQTFFPTPQRTPSPLLQSTSVDDFVINPFDHGSTTTMMSYLTSPNPAPALVYHINTHYRDPSTKHFWWDIRQIRPWTSFNVDTITTVPGLHGLLNIALPEMTFPVPARTSSKPETEADLQAIYSSFYATKLNAALSLSMGNRHLMMRSASAKQPEPSFISNYTDDNSQLIYGRGLGRVVGLVKSYNRWNTGMRTEGNHKKVEYLRGLSHLHRYMREHGCRYGFIMTEIELVVVRNGGDTTPHFGYLEVQTIQLAAHDDAAPAQAPDPDFPSLNAAFSPQDDPEREPDRPKMTACLALWYLHMLARDDTLPGQVSWKSEIGAPAEGTRRKCLPKDDWIPEPQLAEKREAKRARGWVWPEESVGRKELGKRGVKYGHC